MRNPTAQDWQQLERLQEEILAKRLRGLVARWPVGRRVSEAQRRAWRQELHSLRAAIDGDATDEDGGDMDRPRLEWTASTADRHSATGPNGVIGRVRPASASSGITGYVWNVTAPNKRIGSGVTDTQREAKQAATRSHDRHLRMQQKLLQEHEAAMNRDDRPWRRLG